MLPTLEVAPPLTMWAAGAQRQRMSAVAVLVARVVGGGVFVVFGIGKFVNHASEVRSFQDYGLPAPDAFVYVIGAIEIVGGLLLILGLATRPAALVLAGDMVGAIVVSGIALGEVISLTLAPVELALCLFLLWNGPGPYALTARASTRPGREGQSRRSPSPPGSPPPG